MELLGYGFIVMVLTGVAYLFYRLLAGMLKAIHENDD